jgi:predicted nucleic acid-binding protein
LSAIVVDASILLSWCFPDERTEFARRIVARLMAGEVALVPAFWCSEILNSLLVGERRGRITSADTEAFLDEIRAMNPELDYISVDATFGVVQMVSRKYGITPYDALYVELAMRRRCPLATLDLRQRSAAIDLGVECF